MNWNVVLMTFKILKNETYSLICHENENRSELSADVFEYHTTIVISVQSLRRRNRKRKKENEEEETFI